MNEIKIDHSSIETDFLSHLGLEENNRILFTAPFGAGKSTFLQEVFGKNDDYFTIKLFPVNYSVSANEDVFELIKFDLLIELLGNYKDKIELVKEDFSALLLSQMFVLKELKLTPIIFAILKQCGKIGKSSVEIIKEVKKQYGEFKEKMTEDESENIFTFLNLIQNQKGTDHEMDSISTLIKNMVSRIKEKKPNCKSVLVIDDLDRLDPDHTFRLINIFSAHFDKLDNSNKFGFDKVVFVCDFENIRNIFHHKYGSGVDFSGYSDKFFSLVPFPFDNRQYIKEKIEEIYVRIKFSDHVKWIKNESRFFITVKAIINSLIEARLLNLRMIIQYPEFKITEQFYGDKEKKQDSIIESPIIIIFYLLQNFYGSFDLLRSKLNCLKDKLGEYDFSSSDVRYRSDTLSVNKMLLTYCLPFLLPEEFLWESIGSEVKALFIEKFNCKIHYTSGSNSGYLKKSFVKATVGEGSECVEILLNPYNVLLDIFDRCKKLGAFI